jgi:hypothetical protein
MRERMHDPISNEVTATPIDAPSRRMFFRIAMAIVALEPLVIIGVLIFVGVPWWMIACIAVFGVALIAGIFWIIGLLLWRPWQGRYPAQSILEGAVSQSWQSFAFGRLGRLNNCVTIVADEKHLHLLPMTPLRWVGCGVISLPLDRIANVRPGFLPSQTAADIDGREITGPDWALQLGRTAAEA